MYQRPNSANSQESLVGISANRVETHSKILETIKRLHSLAMGMLVKSVDHELSLVVQVWCTFMDNLTVISKSVP